MEQKNNKIIIKDSKNGKSQIMLGDMDVSGFVSEYHLTSSNKGSGVETIWLKLVTNNFVIQKGD